MESSILGPIINKISISNILDKAALFALPMWLLNMFYPAPFESIVLNIPVKDLPNWVPNSLMQIINVLVPTSELLFKVLCVLLLLTIIKALIGSIYWRFNTYGESFSSKMLESITLLFFRSALYTTALAIYSQLLLTYPAPMVFLQTSNAYWYSIIPSWIVLGIFAIKLVLR